MKEETNCYSCTCERCSHKWITKSDETPKVCPKCKSPYWDTKKKEEKSIVPILVTVCVAIIVVAIPAYLLSDYMYTQGELDYLRDELVQQGNVTEDYRQGWLDCVEALDDLRNKVTNITSQMDAAWI